MGPERLTFVVGSGRCGTMTMANVLNTSSSCVSLHEGQFRQGTTAQHRLLPHLCLQNLAAYLEPGSATELLDTLRRPHIEAMDDTAHLVDVAYYYGPFVSALAEVFPQCRLVILVRDGKHVVSSLYTADVPDPMPGGYVDPREYTPHEKFGHAGRLRPREGSADAARWASYSPFQKNCWLWTETYRIVLDAAEAWDPKRVMIARFEDLIKDHAQWMKLLRFLEIDDISPQTIDQILAQKLNARSKKVLPHPDEWSAEQVAQFEDISGDMMARLHYS